MSGENYAIHIPMHISGGIIKRLINGFPNLAFKMFGAGAGAAVCMCVFKCFVTPRAAERALFASPDTCYFQFSVCCFAPVIAECKITWMVWLIVFVYCDNYDRDIWNCFAGAAREISLNCCTPKTFHFVENKEHTRVSKKMLEVGASCVRRKSRLLFEKVSYQRYC